MISRSARTRQRTHDNPLSFGASWPLLRHGYKTALLPILMFCSFSERSSRTSLYRYQAKILDTHVPDNGYRVSISHDHDQRQETGVHALTWVTLPSILSFPSLSHLILVLTSTFRIPPRRGILSLMAHADSSRRTLSQE